MLVVCSFQSNEDLAEPGISVRYTSESILLFRNLVEWSLLYAFVKDKVAASNMTVM